MVQGLSGTFPIAAFPARIRLLIETAHDILGYPVEFFGSAILTAVAVAIGSRRVLVRNSSWVVKPILFMAIVGDPGTNKSHPLKFAFGPLWDRTHDGIENYTRNLTEYRRALRNDPEGTTADKPRCSQILVSDITRESVAGVHRCNPHGLGVVIDELAQWFHSMDQYHKGGDKEFWLSVYNGGGLTVNRKSTDDVESLRESCVSVIGTIQPDVLCKDLAGDDQANGFQYRILQARMTSDEVFDWNDNEFPEELTAFWKDFLLGIYDKCEEDYNVFECVAEYRYSEKAHEHVMSWRNDRVHKLKCCGTKTEIGVFDKVQDYANKFALILQTMYEFSGETAPSAVVDMNAAVYATLLADYFFWSALETVEQIEESSPATMKKNQVRLFEMLESTFTTAEAKEKGKVIGMSESAVNRFLRKFKGVLFDWDEHGRYTKRI